MLVFLWLWLWLLLVWTPLDPTDAGPPPPPAAQNFAFFFPLRSHFVLILSLWCPSPSPTVEHVSTVQDSNLHKHTKIPRTSPLLPPPPPKREKKERKFAGDGKKREIVGPPPVGPTPPFGAPLLHELFLPATEDGRVGRRGEGGWPEQISKRFLWPHWPMSNWPKLSAPLTLGGHFRNLGHSSFEWAFESLQTHSPCWTHSLSLTMIGSRTKNTKHQRRYMYKMERKGPTLANPVLAILTNFGQSNLGQSIFHHHDFGPTNFGQNQFGPKPIWPKPILASRGPQKRLCWRGAAARPGAACRAPLSSRGSRRPLAHNLWRGRTRQ